MYIKLEKKEHIEILLVFRMLFRQQIQFQMFREVEGERGGSIVEQCNVRNAGLIESLRLFVYAFSTQDQYFSSKPNTAGEETSIYIDITYTVAPNNKTVRYFRALLYYYGIFIRLRLSYLPNGVVDNAGNNFPYYTTKLLQGSILISTNETAPLPVQYSLNTVEPCLTVNSLMLLFCPGETPIHFLIRKPVNTANGHILKSQPE